MDMRITMTQLSYLNRSTTVTVDLLERIGVITRVAETLTLTLPGLYENNPRTLDYKVALLVSEAGFDVLVPPDPIGTEPPPAMPEIIIPPPIVENTEPIPEATPFNVDSSELANT